MGQLKHFMRGDAGKSRQLYEARRKLSSKMDSMAATCIYDRERCTQDTQAGATGEETACQPISERCTRNREQGNSDFPLES